MEKMNNFEVGNIYEMRFITDSELRPKFICVKRTAKTVLFERFMSPVDKMTRRIRVHAGVEYVVEGCYSMAPSIYASDLVG